MSSCDEAAPSDVRRVIFDCDMGTDDAVALYLLLVAEMQRRVKLEMIVCTRGNTSVDNVCRNVVRLLEAARRTDIPVYRGAPDALLPRAGQREGGGGGGGYHGADGFGDLEHARAPDVSAWVRPEAACVAMRALIVRHPRAITLVCTAPLTNCALLLRLYGDDVVGQLRDVHIMGGNHLGVGNCSAAAEFNFHADPEAAHIVLACADCPIHLLTWECCSATRTRMKWRMEALKAADDGSDGAVWRLIDRAERSVYATKCEDYWWVCDAYVVATLLHPQMVLKQTPAHIDVELNGRLTRGQAVVDHTREKQPNAVLIEEIDYKLFEELIFSQHTLL